MALLASFLDSSSSHTRSLGDALVNRLTEVLLSSPLLGRLSFLQRHYDPCDIEGLGRIIPGLEHVESVADLASLGLDLANVGRNEWEAFLDSPLPPAPPPAESSPAPETLRSLLLAYLVSATFKDCSILLRMPPQFSRTGEVHAAAGYGRVAAVDLDPKPVQRLGHYVHLDQAIWSAFAEHVRVEEQAVGDACVEDED
jgi:inositol-pentakisphosphate 2-kinase